MFHEQCGSVYISCCRNDKWKVMLGVYKDFYMTSLCVSIIVVEYSGYQELCAKIRCSVAGPWFIASCQL